MAHQQQPGPQQRAKFPMNAFMIWSHERRRQISEQNPNMHPTEIFKHLGNEWKKMNANDKKPYSDRAKRLWQQYKIDNPDYKAQFAKKPKLIPAANMGVVGKPSSNPHKRQMMAHASGGGAGMRVGDGSYPSTSAFGSAASSSQDESAPLGDMVTTTHRNLRSQGLVREAAQFKKYVLDLVSNYDFIMLEHRNA